MSFAVAVRWVYVDGHRTSYTALVEEAAQWRGELAQLRARATALPTSTVDVAEMPALPDLAELQGETALLDWVSWARSALPPLRSHLEDLAHQALSQRLGAALPPPRARRSATEELAEMRRQHDTTPSTPATARSSPENEHQHALAAVRQLLADVAAEITPQEHPELAARLTELTELDPAAATTSVAAVREAHHAVQVAVYTAVHRHRAVLDREHIRHRMLGECVDVAEHLRTRLHSEIAAATDPTQLATRLQQARQASAQHQARTQVAHAAAAALAEVGCAVLPAHTDELTDTGETTLGLAEAPGYGLRLRLPRETDQLSASLVRYEATEPAQDEATSRWFCREKQPAFQQTLQQALNTHAGAQLHLHERLRLEPGDRPLPRVAHPASHHDEAGHEAEPTHAPHYRHR